MKDFVFNNTSLAEAVNQRVLGSSPRGGASNMKKAIYEGRWLFVLTPVLINLIPN